MIGFAVRFLLPIFGIGLHLSLLAASEPPAFQWPHNARAAICLTYDDGLDEHLDHALPDLNSVGIRGTFFVPGNAKPLSSRLPEWRQLARQGHELGNHSLFHPCRQKLYNGEFAEWVWPEFALETYTVRQMALELKIANTLLSAIDGRHERTYAYTCSHFEAGGQSYVAKVRAMFYAARVDGSVVSNLRQLDLHKVPAVTVADGATADVLISMAEAAAGKGGLAVFIIHGVGEEHKFSISRISHRKFLAYLAENRHRFWIETFLNVMRHVKREKKRLGWQK
jgi:sialate O-acetylesterase